MADITIINWDKVKDSFIDKTLATLKDATVANADVSAAPKVGIEGVELSFDASAKLTISAFNESTDTDDEQVVGVAGSKTADGDTLDPKIPYIAENAWLRYSLVGELTAGVKASLNAVGVGVDAESQIVFSDYRVHKPADAADTTVLSDLAAPRTALKIDDIRDLGNSEALYYELRGKLAFSVTVSWSDIYTKTLSEIAKELPATKAFAIDIEVGANAKFEVTLTDDFVLVFWRDTAGQLHTGVKKASSRGTAATLGFGVTAKFSDPDAATKAATDFLEGYLTKPLDAVNAIIAKAGNVQLSDDEKKVLKALGIDPDSANAGDAAKKALDDLQKKLETKIKTVAELEIGASWKYEYSRVESSKFIVEAPITDTQLTALHPSLVAQNVQPLLDDSSIVLTKYLDETTVVRKRSFGFSLGIGKWFTIGDQDQSELTVRTRHSRDKSRSMISYVGARKFGGDGVWKIKPLAFDFRAEMSEYVADPKTSNFDYGITLSMEMTEQTLNEDVIATLLDNASLWSIVADDDADDVREKLSSIEGKATARFELTFDKATLGLIAPIAGHRNPLVMGRALAAAMPWSTDAARRAWKIRRTLYAPAWAAVLNGKDSQTAYAFVKDAVKAVDFAMSERDGKLDQLFNLRRLIEVHPDIAAHYTKWSNGMASLAQAIAPGSLPHTENANIFRNLYDYFSQVLYARAIGNALTQITSANVGRAATVTYKDADGKEQTLAIGSKA